MAATAISLAVSWALTRTLPMMPLVSGVVVFVFGGLTLWLNNDTFIKMKPTIVNTLFGAVLLGGLFFGKSLLGYVFDSAFKLDAEGWRKLTFRWGVFFLLLAVLNEVVWRGANAFYLSDLQAADDLWVAFKVWGIMPITLIFTFSQMPLIVRHSLEDGMNVTQHTHTKNKISLPPSRNMDSPDWLLGASIFVGGILLFALQFYWWIRYGKWTPLSIIDAAKAIVSDTYAPWFYDPQDWMVLHDLLNWLSLPAVLLVVGFCVMAQSRNS
jgi:intracellular septation protein A